ncbi:MAG TPA: glycosyltransferase family 4 protein [Actinomycetota bacterium]|nr:glycosyltransferase family 4 protein [Actinomycetota bacterium]
MKIMLIGHACAPYVGSEPAITWNWAWELSARHEVTVLTHPTHREMIESHLDRFPRPSLRFRWIEVPHSPWKPHRGQRFIRIHYLMWQRRVMRAARAEALSDDYTYVHYISWNSVSAAPDLRGFRIPVVWGPVGGGQTAPVRFLRYFGRAAITEVLRMLRVRSLLLWPRFRRAARATRPALAINRETESLLRRAGCRGTRLFLELGIAPDAGTSEPAPRNDGDGLVVMWAGRLEEHKGLPLALEALRLVDRPIELRVVGGGRMLDPWKRRAAELEVSDRVSFLGQVPLYRMPQLYRDAHLFLFTSLRDSSGGVVFEAIGAGLPCVVPDHQGMAAHAPDEAVIRFPMRTPRDTVRAIASALESLHDDEQLRRRLAAGARSVAPSFTWTRKIGSFERLLEEEGIA